MLTLLHVTLTPENSPHPHLMMAPERAERKGMPKKVTLGCGFHIQDKSATGMWPWRNRKSQSAFHLSKAKSQTQKADIRQRVNDVTSEEHHPPPATPNHRPQFKFSRVAA